MYWERTGKFDSQDTVEMLVLEATQLVVFVGDVLYAINNKLRSVSILLLHSKPEGKFGVPSSFTLDFTAREGLFVSATYFVEITTRFHIKNPNNVNQTSILKISNPGVNNFLPNPNLS